jgi:hypothetical protein
MMGLYVLCWKYPETSTFSSTSSVTYSGYIVPLVFFPKKHKDLYVLLLRNCTKYLVLADVLEEYMDLCSSYEAVMLSNLAT